MKGRGEGKLLLNGVCVCVYAQSFPTLCDPLTIATRLLHPWDFSGKNTEWVVISSSRGSS